MAASSIKPKGQCQAPKWHYVPALFYTPVREAQHMTSDTIRVVALVLLVVVIAIIFLRRKGKKSKGDDDEF